MICVIFPNAGLGFSTSSLPEILGHVYVVLEYILFLNFVQGCME